MKSANKKIIAIEGMDGVGKTTLVENWRKMINSSKDPILRSICNPEDIVFEHFPTEGSEARRIRKTEKNIDEEKLQVLMMEDIVQRIDRFCNKDKESIMICDRFLFSNFLYSFNMDISTFFNKLNEIWREYNLPMYDIFSKKYLTTILVEIPEEERLKRIFVGRPESERDSNETEVYQYELFKRYKYLVHATNKTGCMVQYIHDKFNIHRYYPLIDSMRVM